MFEKYPRINKTKKTSEIWYLKVEQNHQQLFTLFRLNMVWLLVLDKNLQNKTKIDIPQKLYPIHISSGCRYNVSQFLYKMRMIEWVWLSWLVFVYLCACLSMKYQSRNDTKKTTCINLKFLNLKWENCVFVMYEQLGIFLYYNLHGHEYIHN